MNSDIQISRNTNSSLSSADPWSKPSGKGDQSNSTQPQPLKRLHRLLRGRYKLAITLALIGAAVGAIIGFKTQKPLYKSDGLIKIEPIVSRLDDKNEVMPMYNAYLETQVAILSGQRVIDQAMSSDDWRALGRGNNPEAVREFVKYLDISSLPGTYFIRVSFSDPDPSAGPIAVKSLIRSYLQIYGDVDSKDERDKLRFLEDKREKLMSDKRTREEQILSLSKDYGTQDLTELHNARVRDMVALESQLRQAQIQLQQAEASSDETTATTRTASLTDDQISMMDGGILQRYWMQAEDADRNLERLQRNGILENNRLMIQARGEKEYLKSRIAEYTEGFRRRAATLPPRPDGANSPLAISQSVPQLRKNVEFLRTLSEDQKKETLAIGESHINIQRIQNEITHLKENLDETNRLIEQHNVTLSMNGRLKVLSEGDSPVNPSVDKRAQAGALGFIAGEALPIVLLLLIGLMDQRYRYSDDTDTDLSGMQLLGILPNLPDLQGDPRQSAVAAHCVHQIRTLLQLRVNSGDNRVFAITSAGPGDGKTSLTLALGLSFGASGARTLMIDCDLVGGALTRRMKISSTEGILDAMNSRDIEPYLRATDTENVTVLPVGSAGMHDASAFSPSAIRKVVNAARSRFDIILIDTGPVLGSIEASAVAASADGVILTVARGQQRSLVERSLRHLVAVGANVTGIVFNRAEARDFERSVSRYSIRSIASGQKMNGNGNGKSNPDMPNARRNRSSDEYGAVAGAVVSSFKPTHDNDHA